jgi:hypothetical protein
LFAVFFSREGMKSFPAKDTRNDDAEQSGGGRNPEIDFHGETRTNDTHELKTDKDVRLYKKTKGAGSKLSHLGHVLMKNRNGLAKRI